MKKNLFTSLLLCGALAGNAQTPSGIIGHWDMNGTTNDVSSLGHHGHGNNLTPAAGEDGVMGHAWYFNGTNSSITIPYYPALNVAAYSIVAKLKVQGFYIGPCHGNTIFMRGTSDGSGGGKVMLQFTDYPAGYGCTPTYDTSKFSFMTVASSASGQMRSSSFAPFDYTPHVTSDIWYRVVATFNDTVYKIYVNNVLMSSVTIPTPGTPMGIGTDSASIGLDIYDAGAGYAYPFKGVMDDLLIYNRALSAAEIGDLSTDFTLGLESDVAASDRVSDYPNPAHNEITISSGEVINQIDITNVVGQTVYAQQHNSEQVQVNVTELPAGMYLIRINNSVVKKFVKE